MFYLPAVRPLLLLLNLGLLAALAVSAAHWTWVFWAPATTGALSVGSGVPANPAQSILDARLFQLATAPTVADDIVLDGVFSHAPSHGGYAILTVDGKTQTVAAGAQLTPELVLKAVYPHHVVLSRRGVDMVVPLHHAVVDATIPVVSRF
jgi:hypothetical protein